MKTEPKQYHNADRSTTVSQWWHNHKSITMITEPQQYHN